MSKLYHPRREKRLTQEGTQGWHNATLEGGCLVLTWHDESDKGGIRALTADETRNLFAFLEEYKDEISQHEDVILIEKEKR